MLLLLNSDYGVMKKTFKLDYFFNQSFELRKAYKMCNSAIFTHLAF